MFTRNQIEEIREKLQLEGIKDTQFPQADTLRGNETLAIVQQGLNKQLGLKDFIEKIGVYTLSDFLNISKSNEDSYTLEEAIASVEPINRKAGQVITFMDSETGDWAIYQFKGKTASEWLNTELWDNILAKVDSHFKGWFLNECILNTYYPRPMVGDFAFVGNTLEEGVVYICIKYGDWYNTKKKALDFVDKWLEDNIPNIVEEYLQNNEIKVDINVDDALSTESTNPVQNKVITEAIQNINTLKFTKVDSLPETGENGLIYLVPNIDSTDANNKYYEYIWLEDESRYECIGTLGNDGSVYVIDYLTSTSGTITEQQYNELKSAIDDNKLILLVANADTKEFLPCAVSYHEYSSALILIKIYCVNMSVAINVDFTYTSVDNTTIYSMYRESLLVSPEDGTTGQVLTKTSDGYAWQDPQAGDAFPEGGTVGQVLKKTADGVEWGDDNDTVVTVNNTLTSTSTTEALSAAQGKVLNDKIDALDIPDEYSLPTASSTQLGGVKVGEGLEITEDGTLSTSTTSDVNIVKCTQTEYDSNQSKDSNTLYIIYG